MSFTEVLAEIPKMTSEQRRKALHCAAAVEADLTADTPKPGYRAERIDGRLLLVCPRIIYQEEVDAILADFP